MKRIFISLLLTASAAVAGSFSDVELDPPPPLTPVDQLRVQFTYTPGCPIQATEIERRGPVVRVTVLEWEACVSVFHPPQELELDLGFFPVGSWSLELWSGYGSESRRLLLHDETIPFEVLATGGLHAVEVHPLRANDTDPVRVVFRKECTLQVSRVASGDPFVHAFELHEVVNVAPCPPFLESFDFGLGALPAGDHALALDLFRIETGLTDSFELLFPVEPVAATAPDTPYLETVDHFRVDALWRKPDGSAGSATARTLGPRSGLFWFFRPQNTELVVKVLNGCPVNGHYWVFAAGLTNLGVDLVVTDLVDGTTRYWERPVGESFAPVQDVAAFSCDRD